MDNPTTYLINQICAFFLQPQSECAHAESPKHAASLVRLHNEKLSKIGDISFPGNKAIWQKHFGNIYALRESAFEIFQKIETGEDKAEQARNEFLAAATNWLFPVERVQRQGERLAVFLQRSTLMSQCLKQVLKAPTDSAAGYGYLRKRPGLRVQLQTLSAAEAVVESVSNLCLHRARVVRETLSRLLHYSSWTVVEAHEDNVLQLQVVSVAAKRKPNNEDSELPPAQASIIKCGIVSDANTHKLAKLNTQEYLDLRANDMRLMAMHKYGVRVREDRRFCELIQRLGAAAVTVDLLEVKPSSPVHIICNGQGSTKGASFILYNSARLETLLRAFDERVRSSAYGQFPPVDELDLALLNEEEEWQLVYGYIFAFPHLIERCLEQLERGSCATHLIVRFLNGFVAVFSVYYRRVRILTESRHHLMPYVYARIYLIKAVREVLNKTLSLLDIEPVSFM